MSSVVESVPDERYRGVMVPTKNPTALASGLAEAAAREWDPAQLRGSVEFLSWDQYGLTLGPIDPTPAEPAPEAPEEGTESTEASPDGESGAGAGNGAA